MTIFSGWPRRLAIFNADNKGPWGGGSGGEGGGSDNGGSGDGPRNPWAPQPGNRSKVPGPSALDEFIKRARGGGSGGGGGGGRPRIPGTPSPNVLWAIGAALIVAAWFGFTSIHPIGPQQRGVVTFLGRYSGTLEPGIRLTLPAPFNAVQVLDVREIKTDTFPENGGENLMLTGDQNLVDVDYSVRWDISNPQDFAFQIADPKATLRATAESAMRAVMATASLDQAIGSGRDAMEVKVQQNMQTILNSYNAGIRIQGVAIRGAQPPAQVVDSFKKVSAAQQEAVGNVNKARGYAQQILAQAQGQATAFDVIYAQYKLAPEVTRKRMYYETMEQVMAGSDKTIIAAPGVNSYLPLPGGMRRLPEPQTPAPQATAPQSAPQTGAGQ
ncbi:protease modulator HflK [Sphingomonas immobilis]|uniref:Protease modulator HflK n=1 Tax=Sphingomonas immobilis TaxID=3063997 RepID=A0ABT9A074_9SPHN|nr:protease modulator HflK [Sphingomonas sp. CA1-15]MDO7843238.1 protease modulator HflK [Sphingomonas sp. CA1-15]